MGVSRQVRRKLERERLKQLKKAGQATQPQQLQPQPQAGPARDQVGLLMKEVEGLTKSIKLIDNHIWMLVETLSDKGILNWSDVNEMENKYMEREKQRRTKIQQLLSSDLPADALLSEIEEDPNLKNYEKLSINPTKELNLNPFEVAAYLKEMNPGLTEEQYLGLKKEWGLTPEHFGFKEKKDDEKSEEPK
jgi:hypothetical protein